MVNEMKEYINFLLSKDLRADGRKFDEYRKPIKVEYGVSAKSAEGSARVIIGETEVVAGVKLAVDSPYPDTPDEGSITVNVELLPLSSPEFESGPPGVDAIELSRVVDRGIREAKTIDFKKLCIKKGEKVWIIYIDIYPINDAGNLFDAANIAALAALKDTKYPKYEDEKVVYERTNKPLQLENLPLACTLSKIGNKIFVDTTSEEETASDARLTVVTLEDGSVSALQKGGIEPMMPEEVLNMIDIAAEKGKELRKYLK